MIKCSMFLFLCSPLIMATQYWVSTTGSDSNSGTSEQQAWQHINVAAQRVGAGDIVNVLPGTYNEEHDGYGDCDPAPESRKYCYAIFTSTNGVTYQSTVAASSCWQGPAHCSAVINVSGTRLHYGGWLNRGNNVTIKGFEFINFGTPPWAPWEWLRRRSGCDRQSR
jgi:hypothetical protein